MATTIQIGTGEGGGGVVGKTFMPYISPCSVQCHFDAFFVLVSIMACNPKTTNHRTKLTEIFDSGNSCPLFDCTLLSLSFMA